MPILKVHDFYFCKQGRNKGYIHRYTNYTQITDTHTDRWCICELEGKVCFWWARVDSEPRMKARVKCLRGRQPLGSHCCLGNSTNVTVPLGIRDESETHGCVRKCSALPHELTLYTHTCISRSGSMKSLPYKSDYFNVLLSVISRFTTKLTWLA